MHLCFGPQCNVVASRASYGGADLRRATAGIPAALPVRLAVNPVRLAREGSPANLRLLVGRAVPNSYRGVRFEGLDFRHADFSGPILRRSGPLAPRQAARLAAEVARALSAAHARGIVHRDVKPGNIMLSSEGRVKVGDFGIARAIADAQMTLPGMTLGSVHYFSPEQARGEQATTSSDVYSLGIVLFEALTGRRPFEGDSAASIAIARLSGPPPDPSEFREGIPPALVAIVRRAMALEPADRFPSAAAMGRIEFIE